MKAETVHPRELDEGSCAQWRLAARAAAVASPFYAPEWSLASPPGEN